MNCAACKIEISPNFIAAIKDNRCPACGQKCLSDEDYGAIFNVVSSILSVVPELGEDATVKIATAMHGKFDIFPKGVVVDGYAVKEIVYVSTAAPGRMAPPVQSHYTPRHDMSQPMAPPARLSAQQMEKARSLASVIEEMEREDADDGIVNFASDGDLRRMEAERLAAQKMERMRANNAGIK
jgi:hypothetical protein